MTIRSFTYAEYVALGMDGPWTGPFALENRAARDAGGAGKYYRSRGMDPLGGCVHITAGISDFDPPDHSAESTTRWGSETTTDASWTGIVDSDSIINCLRPDRVGWVQGVPGYNFNKPLVGVEIGLRTTDWDALPPAWVAATLKNLAAVFAPYVIRYKWPLRLVTDRDEVQRLIDQGVPVGFTEHWRLTPQTRSDAGRVGAATTFPWSRFFDVLRAQIALLTTPGGDMTLPAYPTRSSIKTDGFWYALQKVIAYEGFDITCGPSFVDQGYCVKGRHGHWDQSRHWVRRALDISRDPRQGVPVSDYELTHLTAKALMLRAYYSTSVGLILNRPTDHKDHLHVDDGQSGYQVTGVYRYDLLAGELVYGMTGSAVRLWQQALVDAGVTVAVDGSYGLKTFWATRQAQYDWGLRGDGIVGNLSREAARKNKKVTPPPPPAPAPAPPEPEPVPQARIYRISGANRYATLDDAANRFTLPEGDGLVVAADGTSDLHAATLLAARGLLPMLSVPPSATVPPASVIDAVRRERPRFIVVVGGATVIPEAVATRLAQAAKESA